MLRSLRQLYGKKLGASDGDIGHVKDFYFNDDNGLSAMLSRTPVLGYRAAWC
jgi:hypothetical protein